LIIARLVQDAATLTGSFKGLRSLMQALNERGRTI